MYVEKKWKSLTLHLVRLQHRSIYVIIYSTCTCKKKKKKKICSMV